MELSRFGSRGKRDLSSLKSREIQIRQTPFELDGSLNVRIVLLYINLDRKLMIVVLVVDFSKILLTLKQQRGIHE